MQNQEQFETVLKAALKESSKNVLPSEGMFDRIKKGIVSDRSEMIMAKENFSTSRFNLKKVVAIGVCCTFLLAGSVFAADYISKYASGFLTEKDYTSAPSKAEIKKDAGFEAKLPEALPGGFKLDDASLARHIDGSSEAKKDDTRKVASAKYSKADSGPQSYLTLSASNDDNETLVGKDSKTVSINGITAYYWEYTLHVVPSDYKPSDKEIAQEEAGSLVTVYLSPKKGSSQKITESSTAVKSLKWKDNGINYVLGDKGHNLTLAELTNIAENIINTK